MPGGVDMHCHIAGPKVNAARMLRPEDSAGRSRRPPHGRPTRSGTLGSVPSTFATGYQYAGLGYTTAFDAAIPPLAARHAHEEFRDTPVIDKGFFVLMGNNHYVMDRIRAGRARSGCKAFVAWLLDAAEGLRREGRQPRRRRELEAGAGATSTASTTRSSHFGVTPRQIILVELARAVDELGLPHPVHIHATTSACPATGRRRWRRCRPSTAIAAT